MMRRAKLYIILGLIALAWGCQEPDINVHVPISKQQKPLFTKEKKNKVVTLPSSGNVKFDMLRPFFTKFIQSRGVVVNPFKSNLAQFAPKVQIVIEEKKKPVEKKEPRSPLEYHPLNTYKLVAVISGTAIPKAMVVDSKGIAYIVRVGTPIGNEGGKVTSITSDGIVVEIPGKQPVVMKLMESSSEMAKIIQNMYEF